MSIRTWLLFLVTCSVFISCSENERFTQQTGDALAQLDFSAFDTAIESFLSAHKLAGASAAIVHQDQGIVYERGYGEYEPDRLYLVADSSKILSAGILMALADKNLLDIDAPLSTYLGESGFGKDDITVAQLISNSSGLLGVLDTPDPIYLPYVCQYAIGDNLTNCGKAIYTVNDSADLVAPDSEFHYGGGQWQLAGGIAEVTSGKKWAQLVEETYNHPCGTPSLGYSNHLEMWYIESLFAGESPGTSYPKFFKADKDNLSQTDNPNIEGGAYISAHDFGNILLMQLRKGLCGKNRVMSEDSVARMQKDRVLKYNGETISSNLEGYGLGWWIDRDEPGVVGDDANNTILWLDAERNYGAVVLLEYDSRPGGGGELWAELKGLADAVFDKANE